MGSWVIAGVGCEKEAGLEALWDTGGRGWRANEIAFCLSKTLLSPTCYFTQPRSMVTGAHNMRFHSEARDQ